MDDACAMIRVDPGMDGSACGRVWFGERVLKTTALFPYSIVSNLNPSFPFSTRLIGKKEHWGLILNLEPID